MAQQLICRPPVAQLTYQGFDRPIHPEIIESISSRRFKREQYHLALHLTPSGHVIEWRWKNVHLVEILGGKDQVFPEHPFFAHRIGGERSECFFPSEDVSYQTCFQMERIPDHLYYQVDGELRDDSKRVGVLQVLSSSDRLGLSPLSYVDLQARTGSLVIHAYHTFPGEYTIVKSQTLIEFGEE